MSVRRPAQLDVKRALELCVRLLSARGRTRAELTERLAQRGYPAVVSTEALERVHALGYLDDARFAVDRAERLLRDGRKSAAAILHRLQAHGLNHSQAQSALDAARVSTALDEEATARALLERRGLMLPVREARALARAGRLLSAQGFDPELIERLLGQSSLYPSGNGD